MCSEGTVQNLFTAVEGSVIAVLNATGNATTPLGKSIEAELSDIQTDLATWKKGTPAQDIIQILGDVQTALGGIPGIPANIQLFVGIAIAGIKSVIGALTGNGPVPAAADPAAFSAHVMAQTLQGVRQTAPDFHYHKGLFSKPADQQYTAYWNEKADASGMPDLKISA